MLRDIVLNDAASGRTNAANSIVSLNRFWLVGLDEVLKSNLYALNHL